MKNLKQYKMRVYLHPLVDNSELNVYQWIDFYISSRFEILSIREESIDELELVLKGTKKQFRSLYEKERLLDGPYFFPDWEEWSSTMISADSEQL